MEVFIMEIKTKAHTSEEIKSNIAVSFAQIVEKCETVGDLKKLNKEVKKLKMYLIHI